MDKIFILNNGPKEENHRFQLGSHTRIQNKLQPLQFTKIPMKATHVVIPDSASTPGSKLMKRAAHLQYSQLKESDLYDLAQQSQQEAKKAVRKKAETVEDPSVENPLVLALPDFLQEDTFDKVAEPVEVTLPPPIVVEATVTLGEIGIFEPRYWTNYQELERKIKAIELPQSQLELLPNTKLEFRPPDRKYTFRDEPAIKIWEKEKQIFTLLDLTQLGTRYQQYRTDQLEQTKVDEINKLLQAVNDTPKCGDKFIQWKQIFDILKDVSIPTEAKNLDLTQANIATRENLGHIKKQINLHLQNQVNHWYDLIKSPQLMPNQMQRILKENQVPEDRSKTRFNNDQELLRERDNVRNDKWPVIFEFLQKVLNHQSFNYFG